MTEKTAMLSAIRQIEALRLFVLVVRINTSVGILAVLLEITPDFVLNADIAGGVLGAQIF